MENTSPFLFDNIDQNYFLALKGKALGPLTAQEVFEHIQKGEAGLMSYIWKESWPDWKRICDERTFATLIPQKPTVESISSIRQKTARMPPPPAAIEEEVKNFYAYSNNSQYGPFSFSELRHLIKGKKLGRSSYVWIAGWPNWKRLSELPEFANLLSPPPEDRTIGARLDPEVGVDASEKRKTPRRPLVARLFLHNDQDVIIAVCRDVSVGGMQVLTDRIPGPVGTQIKLNVSAGDSSKVKSFVAEGEVVRILEDGRGFSFRFKKISTDAKKMIEQHIKGA